MWLASGSSSSTILSKISSCCCMFSNSVLVLSMFNTLKSPLNILDNSYLVLPEDTSRGSDNSGCLNSLSGWTLFSASIRCWPLSLIVSKMMRLMYSSFRLLFNMSLYSTFLSLNVLVLRILFQYKLIYKSICSKAVPPRFKISWRYSKLPS